MNKIGLEIGKDQGDFAFLYVVKGFKYGKAELMQKLRLMLSTSHDAWVNLAIEEWIFRTQNPVHPIFFLWQNSDVVVIGRNQNPWSECRLDQMDAEQVKLARRSTGGGAVFHDLGNLCFTFLTSRKDYDRERNTRVLLAALSNLGIEAQAQGRNDITTKDPQSGEDRKISGSAFRETADRAFHHGTLLLRTDLSRLSRYLNPHPKKLQGKGKASVRSRVMNISEILPDLRIDDIKQNLFKAFVTEWGDRSQSLISPEEISEAELKGDEFFRSTHARYSSWDWRIGQSPEFSLQFTELLSFGMVDFHLKLEHGHIQEVEIFTDALNENWVESVKNILRAAPMQKNQLQQLAGRCALQYPEGKLETEEFFRWFLSVAETETI